MIERITAAMRIAGEPRRRRRSGAGCPFPAIRPGSLFGGLRL